MTPVSVVTGAASGIGRATARLLTALGDTVVGVDCDGDGLEQTAGEVSGNAGTFIAERADVSAAAQCEAVMATAAQHGPLRTLVNSAGIMPADDTVEDLSVDGWDRTFAVNVRAIFLLARHGLPLMRPDGGVIINLSSVHAFATQPGSMAYAATKGAIVALTRQLALELAPEGIRVVAVAPGSVDTPMSDLAVQRSGASSLTDLGFSDSPRAAGRIGSAAEIAEVISWLTTPAAAFVNGTTLEVDGALLAALPTPHSPPSPAVAREGTDR